MKVLSDLDASYIAGIVDGEGCVHVTKVRNVNSKSGFVYRSGVVIGNTSFSLLRWIKNTIGAGTIKRNKKHPRHKQSWQYNLWSDEASRLLEQLIPYLLVKEKQAFNQIAFQAGMTWHGSHGAPQKEIRRREKHARRSHVLNKRGD